MWLRAVLLGGWLVPATAAADSAGGPRPPPPPPPDDVVPVIGGSNATDGKWPDAAAVMYPSVTGDVQGCSGTLVAPTVVLTAGHCADGILLPLPHSVLIGTASLARPGNGETIAIQRGIVYPDASATEDIAILVLARPSSRPPRRLATGWARFDIADGAQVSLVGFGAVDKNGEQYVNELQEASSTITDFDCSHSSGCNAAARPAGELGAGGRGVDTCPGDSGGPLYVVTSYGALLAGVTSRSYDDAVYACSEGGIYVRPDKLVGWIEQQAGVTVAHGPEPTADRIVAVRGDGGDTRIAVNDPGSDAHRFELTSPPAHGTANLRGDGAVRVCVDPDAPPGADALTVTIVDTRHEGRALPITIDIAIQDGTPPPTCDLGAFASGGCCDGGGGSGGAIPLAIGLVALIRRRARLR